MSSRFALVTDIHANWHALRAIIDDVADVNSSCIDNPYRFWSLGDIIGYGPHPVECLNWLRYKSRIGDRWVPGNHDAWLINPEGVNPDADESLKRHRDLLAEDTQSELGRWFREELYRALGTGFGIDPNNEEPRWRVCEKSSDWTLFFVHANLFDRRRTYLWAWDPGQLSLEFGRMKKEVGEDANAVLFCGHAHYPLFARQLPNPDESVALQSIRYFTRLKIQPGLTIINPGSAGQPRDGDSRAAYALFDAEDMTIEFRRVGYDVDKTIADLDEKKYPKSLGERLATGNGKSELASYFSVYRRPRWDLEAYESSAPGELPEEPDEHWYGRRGDA